MPTSVGHISEGFGSKNEGFHLNFLPGRAVIIRHPGKSLVQVLKLKRNFSSCSKRRT